MCASRGTKFSSMNEAVASSLYDSASSRAQAPQAGAALKSISRGFLLVLASASAASASFNQCTFIVVPPVCYIQTSIMNRRFVVVSIVALAVLFCQSGGVVQCIPCMLMSILPGRMRRNSFHDTGLLP